MKYYKDFDLKEFREKVLQMKKQADLAQALGTRQDAISRWEKNSEGISLKSLIELAEVAGVTLDEMLHYKKPLPASFGMKDVWDRYMETKFGLLESINGLRNLSNGKDVSGVSEVLARIRNTIIEDFAKPQIAFAGLRSSGKSTLINALLGREALPAGWNGTTSIPVYIKHIEDRPEFMKDDVCWIFHRDENGDSFDDDLIYDEKYCSALKYASGDETLLDKVGTMSNRKKNMDADTAVLFLDSSILRSVDLVDIPGIVPDQLASGRNVDKPFWNIIHKATAVVYLSRAISFFENEEQIAFLSVVGALRPFYTKNREKVDNLLIVASHCHEMGRDEKALEKLDIKQDSFFGQLPSQERYVTKDICVRNAEYYFFPYSINYDENKSFNRSLAEMIEELARAAAEDGIEAVKTVRDNAVKYLQKSSIQSLRLQQALILPGKLDVKKESIDQSFNIRIEDAKIRKNRVFKTIRQMKEESRIKIGEIFEDELSEDNVRESIEHEKGTDGKWAINDVVRHTYNSMRSRYGNIFPKKDEKVYGEIRNYLKSFSADDERYKEYDTPLTTDLGDDFDEQNIYLDAIGVRKKFRINMQKELTVPENIKEDEEDETSERAAGAAAAAAGMTAARAVQDPVMGFLGAGTALVAGGLLAGLFGMKKMTTRNASYTSEKKKSNNAVIRQIFKNNRVKEQLLNQSDAYWMEKERQFARASDTVEMKWNEYAAQKKEILYSLLELKTQQEELEKSGEISEANAFVIVAISSLKNMKIEL
ncbi:dynamin family protein [uncultured Dialister sp.]|uniref:dynamin family protein n=1 Tax=uncultured Dialister sp. TaxID=278064 RepID=UPI0025CDAC74|nr:dynamin family protein [uncultured Dialister sp.]